MIAGRAFLTPGSDTARIPVAKSWQSQGQGQGAVHTLIESCDFWSLKPALNRLGPPRSASLGPVLDDETALALATPSCLDFEGSKAFLEQERPSPVSFSAIVCPKPHFPADLYAENSPLTRPGVVIDWIGVPGNLLDINFTAPWVTNTGPAAVGQTNNNFWNEYCPWYGPTLTNLWWADGTNRSGIDLIVQNAPGIWGNSTGNNMYDVYIYAGSGNITITLTNVPSGVYDLYLYGHGAADDQNSYFDLPGTNLGTKNTATGPWWNNNQLAGGDFIETNHYMVFRGVQVTQYQPLTLGLITTEPLAHTVFWGCRPM